MTLKGKIIVSTRPLYNNDELSELLKKKGATVINFSMIKFAEIPIDTDKINILKNINQFTHIIFTSQNGVRYFFNILKKNNIIISNKVKFAVIGNKTAKELRAWNYKPDFISGAQNSDIFGEQLKNKVVTPNDSVLIAVSNLARTTIEEQLLQVVKTVQRIDVYQIKNADNYPEETSNKIKSGQYDIIIFTSPSGVNKFMEIFSNRNIKSACIGKTTEKALLRHNITPLVTATNADAEIFANEIENYLQTN